MKNKEQNENYINMSKDELIKLLNFNIKKHEKAVTLNTYSVLLGLLLCIASVILFFRYPIPSILIISASYVIPVFYLGPRSKKYHNEIINIKKQLENIVLIDYEKERYKTDIEHKEKTESLKNNNDLSKVSIDEYYNFKRMNDLIKYRDELVKLNANNNINTINNEVKYYSDNGSSLTNKKFKILTKKYKMDNN